MLFCNQKNGKAKNSLDFLTRKLYNRRIMKFNYHTHTIRCHHAKGEDREYVEKAIEVGMKTLGFSDHAPYLFDIPSPSTQRKEVRAIEDYANSINALKKEYEKDIRILLGFELEYYPKTHEKEMEFLQGNRGKAVRDLHEKTYVALFE